MIGFVEARGRAAGVENPFQGTIATTDGHTLWAFRYSSIGKSRTLFVTRDVATLRRQYPDKPLLREVADDARLVLSEPIGDLPGAWEEVPEATYLVARQGHDEMRPFAPRF
jgi:glutamine amidotransferase